jgi:hypothetical protein
LVAAHFLNKLGIEVKLRWIPDGCEIDGAHESTRAATEGAKYKPPPKGPDAFIKDVKQTTNVNRRRDSEGKKQNKGRKMQNRGRKKENGGSRFAFSEVADCGSGSKGCRLICSMLSS